MFLEEINGWTLEELCSMSGIDAETLIRCLKGLEPKDSLQMNLVKNVLGLCD